MHDVSIDFAAGAMHGIVGPPRSGKTLLLHLLGLLDEPDFGTVELFGDAVSPSPEALRREIRNTVFGYVFASPCLLPAFTVAENVAMPLFRISGANEHLAQRRVCELLECLNIEECANDPVTSLDSDTQFLVALARAVVHRPRLLLLLEPSRPLALAEPVRRLTDALGLTTIWSGKPGDWTAQCDAQALLEHGCIVDPVEP